MKKNIFILVTIVLMFISLIYPRLEAAAPEETINLTLEDIGESETEFAEDADPATRFIIEQTWRNRINEILRRLKKNGVKITPAVVEAVVEALGIDPIGPLTGENLTQLGPQIPDIDKELVDKYVDPSQHVEDVDEEISGGPDTSSVYQ